MLALRLFFFFFFFNDTATTEIYTLSLHDALPISVPPLDAVLDNLQGMNWMLIVVLGMLLDRKSTRLNSSHSQISYAVFCLKKKKKEKKLYTLKNHKLPVIDTNCQKRSLCRSHVSY